MTYTLGGKKPDTLKPSLGPKLSRAGVEVRMNMDLRVRLSRLANALSLPVPVLCERIIAENIDRVEWSLLKSKTEV